jgi:putative membrane protein
MLEGMPESMLEAILIGVCLGIISGLIPGIHNNTFSALILAYLPLLFEFFSPEEVALIIFTNAITHTFIDILPSIFIGVPNEDTALSILPSHEMVLEGRGFQAVSISAFSSMFSFLVSLPVFLLFNLFLSSNWKFLYEITPFFLILVIFFLVFSEKGDIYAASLNIWLKRAYSLFIIVLSGIIGYFAFKYSFYVEIRVGSSVFIPMMLGFFAVPVVYAGMQNRSEIPEQRVTLNVPKVRHVLPGSFSGALVSLFPGVSSGIAAAISTARLKSREAYISAISAANTSNVMLCFSVLFSTGFTRSGAANAFKYVIGSHFNNNEIMNLIFIGLFVAVLSLCITLLLGALFSKFVVKTERVSRLSLAILVFVFLYSFYMTGVFGILILLASSFTGLLTVKLNVKRVACMGCIILPVLLYRLGYV